MLIRVEVGHIPKVKAYIRVSEREFKRVRKLCRSDIEDGFIYKDMWVFIPRWDVVVINEKAYKGVVV